MSINCKRTSSGASRDGDELALRITDLFKKPRQTLLAQERAIDRISRACERIGRVKIFVTGSFSTGLDGVGTDIDLCCWKKGIEETDEKFMDLLKKVRKQLYHMPQFDDAKIKLIRWARIPIVDA